MSQDKSFGGQVARAFAWEGGTKIFVQIVSWVSTIFVTRLLAPGDYGLVAISGIYTGILTLISEFGLGSGLVTRSDVSEEQYSRCFWLGLAAGSILYVALFSVAPLIAAAYDIEALKNIIRVAGLGLLVSALKIVPYSQVLRRLDYKFRAVTEMCGQFLQAASTIVFALLGFSAWSLVIGYLVAQVFVTIVFLTKVRGIGLPNLSLRGMEDLAQFGVKMTSARMLEFAVSNADTLVVSTTLGARHTGIYSVSANFAHAPLEKIGAIFNRVAFPAMARLQGDPGRASLLLLRLHFFLLCAVGPLLLGAAIVAPDIVPLVLGDKWSETARVFQIMCLANVVRVSGMVFPTALESQGKAGDVLRLHLVSIAVMPLGFLVGSHWGILGVTTAWLVTYPIVYVWLLRRALSSLSVQPSAFLKSITPVLLALLSMLLTVLVVRHMILDWSPLHRLLTLVGTGGLVFICALVLFVPTEIWLEFKSVVSGLRPRSNEA